jgi:hypothetical protein
MFPLGAARIGNCEGVVVFAFTAPTLAAPARAPRSSFDRWDLGAMRACGVARAEALARNARTLAAATRKRC